MKGGKGQSCVDMHLIWARNMALYYIVQFQIEFLNFTDLKFLFLYTALKSTSLHFALEAKNVIMEICGILGRLNLQS